MATTFGERLAEERHRLGRSQVMLATSIGASKKSVLDWEGDLASPKATYLMALSREGVDVLYLLTEARSKPVEDTLTKRQRTLLNNYNACDEAGKKFVEAAALRAAQDEQPAQGSVTQSVRGNNALQIGSVGGSVRLRGKA